MVKMSDQSVVLVALMKADLADGPCGVRCRVVVARVKLAQVGVEGMQVPEGRLADFALVQPVLLLRCCRVWQEWDVLVVGPILELAPPLESVRLVPAMCDRSGRGSL